MRAGFWPFGYLTWFLAGFLLGALLICYLLTWHSYDCRRLARSVSYPVRYVQAALQPGPQARVTFVEFRSSTLQREERAVFKEVGGSMIGCRISPGLRRKLEGMSKGAVLKILMKPSPLMNPEGYRVVRIEAAGAAP